MASGSAQCRMNLVSAAERLLRAGERLSQRSGRRQCCAIPKNPSGAWGPQVISLGRAQTRLGQRKRGGGGGCSAHCGTALLRRSRTLEGLPFGSRWSGLDRPSVGGAWPGSAAAVSEAGLVLGLDLEGCKIHSRCDLVPVLATSPSALASKTLREQKQLFS